MAYLESYANHFSLLPYIKFNTSVVDINYVTQQGQDMLSWSHWGGADGGIGNLKGKWEITTTTTTTTVQEHQIYEVEFVILCVGQFSGVPNIPDFPPNKGPDAFINGKVIHSMDYSAMENSDAAKFVKGKRVAVVGYQKSALDIVNECAIANEDTITNTIAGVENPCTLIYRYAHWNVPDYLPYGVSLASLYLNRFSELLLHKPGEGLLLSLLATILSPLLLQQIASCSISTAPEKFYDKIEEGSIVLKKSKGFGFNKDGLVFNDDATAPLETDIVILCTGYKGDEKLKNIFKSPKFQKLHHGECIHPRIPQLAVIGYSECCEFVHIRNEVPMVSTFSDGGFKLPSIKEMEKDYYRKSCIGILHIWYNDQLCKDMGCNPKRKKGLYAELFEPYGPMDYANLTHKN
ncbi:hypothetical protein MKW92_012593 [Papaver armeniacum]|nr:hypothetical protein MKW92_012593 [Papaver armeniacum]